MTAEHSSRIESFALSDTGKVREDNQDAIRVCRADDPLTETHGHVYGLADGMGGYEHGGVASATALEVFFSSFYGANGSQPMAKLKQAVQQANVGVYQAAVRLRAVRMGTTLTAINVVGRQLFVAHVGDSRLYLVRDGQATCLTNDHTTVGDLVRMRVLSPDKVRNHAQRSILNKCLGIELFIQPDVTRHNIEEGDILILCSDGVWSVVQDDEFAQVASNAPDMEILSHNLIALAMDKDSDDNASVVAIRAGRLVGAPEAASQRIGLGLRSFLRSRLTGNL